MGNIQEQTKIVVILLVSVVTCMAESYYNVRIPRKHCKPCQDFSDQGLSECPLLKNDTFEIINHLRPLLGEIKDTLQDESDNLEQNLGADVENFSTYSIIDLEDIRESSIFKFLRAKNKVEEIVHHSYGQTVLLLAYFSLYEEMVQDQEGLEKLHSKIGQIHKKLEELTCNLYRYTSRLGVGKINRKLCKYIKPKKFSDSNDEKDYIIAVLQLGQKSFDSLIENINSLNSQSIIDECKYECSNGERSIKCEDVRELRSGLTRNKRKRNKNRRNRNQNKRRRNKKRCKKNDKSGKGKKRRCRNKKRNKKRSHKKRNICIKCN